MAAEDAQSSGRGCGSTFGAAGADSSTGGYASNSVSWGRAETSCRRGSGCRCGAVPFYSVPMMDLSKVHNYYISCGYTDLRLGIDGLAAVVTQQYEGLSPRSLGCGCMPALRFCGTRFGSSNTSRTSAAGEQRPFSRGSPAAW